MYRTLVSAALLLATAAFAGGNAKPVAPSHVRKGSATAAISDAALESAIRQRFARSKAASEHFQVHVAGGTATIEGQTDVIQRKGAATRMARAAGARQVINRIVISQAARDKANANLAKGRRRVQVKRSEAARR
jgi:hypothetical protein